MSWSHGDGSVQNSKQQLCFTIRPVARGMCTRSPWVVLRALNAMSHAFVDAHHTKLEAFVGAHELAREKQRVHGGEIQFGWTAHELPPDRGVTECEHVASVTLATNSLRGTEDSPRSASSTCTLLAEDNKCSVSAIDSSSSLVYL